MKNTILIVEDDAAFGVMLQTWLKKNDYDVVLATQYAQAKKAIMSQKFDLILTDLRLPDGDGIMLMAWVREQQKSRVPFIVMTGYAEVQTAVSAMKLGAFDYLKKPINPSRKKSWSKDTVRPSNGSTAMSNWSPRPSSPSSSWARVAPVRNTSPR